jgi:hypothetical protein
MPEFKLTKADYIKILKYYNLEIPKNIKDIKKSAEHILAKKLCSCIKKVSPDNEPKSIGICTRTIFNRKHLTRGKFNCIGTRKVEFIKNIKKFNISRKNKKK